MLTGALAFYLPGEDDVARNGMTQGMARSRRAPTRERRRMGAIETTPARGAVRGRSALSWRETAGAYVSLTKPRIISLLLITTVPTMILADGGVPSLWLMLWTVVGGTLAAGGANAINCYLDRDIDELMHRTQGRPLPLGKIEPAAR